MCGIEIDPNKTDDIDLCKGCQEYKKKSREQS